MILNSFNIGALLNITLDGDAKLVHGQTEGAYTLKSTLPNGKQYWRQVQGSDAIWSDNEFQNWKKLNSSYKTKFFKKQRVPVPF